MPEMKTIFIAETQSSRSFFKFFIYLCVLCDLCGKLKFAIQNPKSEI